MNLKKKPRECMPGSVTPRTVVVNAIEFLFLFSACHLTTRLSTSVILPASTKQNKFSKSISWSWFDLIYCLFLFGCDRFWGQYSRAARREVWVDGRHDTTRPNLLIGQGAFLIPVWKLPVDVIKIRWKSFPIITFTALYFLILTSFTENLIYH